MPRMMPRRAVRYGLLWLTAAMLGGCVYDPYTGGYYPCCNYPPPSPPAYRYSPNPYGPPPYPQGYPSPGYPPQGYPQPGQPPSGPPMQQPQAEAPPGPRAGSLTQRFAMANVTHDGRLTREQAEAAGWQMVVRNFPAIDVDQKGFVTLDEIRAWTMERQIHNGGAPPEG